MLNYRTLTDLPSIKRYLQGVTPVAFDFETAPDDAYRTEPRMQIDPLYCDIKDDQLFIRLSNIYDQYTKFRKDYAIVGEVLTYKQFQQQLRHSDLFIASNVQHRFGKDKTNQKCWVIDYKTLCERCDVSGFDITGIDPL